MDALRCPDAHRCPRCKTCDELHSHKAILVSFADWPSALFSAIIVATFSAALGVAAGACGLALLIATLPVLARIVQKHSCGRCGIEFRQDAPEAPPTL